MYGRIGCTCRGVFHTHTHTQDRLKFVVLLFSIHVCCGAQKFQKLIYRR